MTKSGDPDDPIPMSFRSEVIRRPRSTEHRSGVDEPIGITIRLSQSSRPNLPAQVIRVPSSTVVIGRAQSCDLPLYDEQRLVSKRHAQVSLEGEQVVVTDLGSRNFTRLDGRLLEPEVPYRAMRNSTIVIGDFMLQAEPTYPRPSPGAEATVYGDLHRNPFLETGRELADVLLRLGELYDAEPADGRGEALREALQVALGDSSRDVVGALLRALEEGSRRG